MSSHPLEPTTPAAPNAPALVTALNRSEHVKDKVEECAQELSTINNVLNDEDLPRAQIEQALVQSEKVEIKVQECADDLTQVNQVLTGEIRERKRLERKLAENKIELADAQAELTEVQIQEKRARHLALHDVVTGLPNRLLFNDRLKHALAQARRHEWRLAVMFIDLDKFKNINDSHGHDAGDQVLQIVSERLHTSVRGADTVGRQGGDEFLYLMLEVKDEADVAAAACKIIEKIGEPCEFDGLKVIVKASIGIALYPQDGRSVNVLLKNADSAMYRAKQIDKGYSFYALANAGVPRT